MPPPTAKPPTDPSSLIAGRYRLRKHIGDGGFSEVWEADDRITGGRVAVKLLTNGEPARARREVLLLRYLRVPGVVLMLDEGVHEGLPFVVMELVQGAHFPGVGRDSTWASLAEVTIALVETLARVHAMRVIHRDLKPDNVLVTQEGQPILLDFGIAIDERRSDMLTQEGSVLGAPKYLSPEQIVGDPVTEQTDLYAVGLLLYGALTGKLPHDQTSRVALMRERVTRPAPPLRERAPSVPADIAALVDALLERDPRDRPSSALEVLQRLLGRPAARGQELLRARLGGDAVVEAIVRAVGDGRSVEVTGERGAGKTRCLLDAAAELERRGRRVLWALPGKEVFESLLPLVGQPPGGPQQSLAEAMLAMDEALRSKLAGEVTVFADGMDRLDPWSSALLEKNDGMLSLVHSRLTGAPGSASAASVGVELAPITELELAHLFSGPERVFHLPSDAARLLWSRTGGLPGRIDAELRGWLRAGIARRDGESFDIDRDDLDRLQAGVRVLSLPSSLGAPLDEAALPGSVLELGAWISVAAPHADARRLAAAMDRPLWQIEAGVEALCRAGLLRATSFERLEPVAASSAEQLWSNAHRREVHRRLAGSFAPGDPGRLWHLLASTEDANDLAVVADEGLRVARHHARLGHLGRAMAALLEGLVAARDPALHGGDGGTAREDAILATWVEIALAEGTPAAYDRALYELSRASRRSTLVDRLERAMRAASAYGSGGERALAMLASIEPFEDPSHELLRQGLSAMAARRGPVETEVTVLDRMAAWVESTGDPVCRAKLAGWLGRLRYRQGRFAEAARLHAEAAEGEPWAAAQVAARINGASALLEAFDYAQAEAWGTQALEAARHIRHPFYEARAEWLLRATAFRTGAAAAPDEELLAAVARLGVRDFEATVFINEAAIAYRHGLLPRAVALAEHAREIWAFLQTPEAAAVARSLVCAARGEAPPEREGRAIAALAIGCAIPGLGIQALALLCKAGAAPKRAWVKAVPALAGMVPREHWGRRMDVLSVEECLAALNVTLGEGAPRRREG